MAEMLVKTPDLAKQLTEYEFTFNSGMVMPVMLDESLGDVVVETLDRYVLDLVPKPSIGDPEVMIPAETVTVFKNTLATIHKRTRTQRLASPEELAALQSLIHPQPKTIQ